jgi:hypothetical protein
LAWTNRICQGRRFIGSRNGRQRSLVGLLCAHRPAEHQLQLVDLEKKGGPEAALYIGSFLLPRAA